MFLLQQQRSVHMYAKFAPRQLYALYANVSEDFYEGFTLMCLA